MSFYTLGDLVGSWDQGELTLEEVIALWPSGDLPPEDLLRELLRLVLQQRLLMLERQSAGDKSKRQFIATQETENTK